MNNEQPQEGEVIRFIVIPFDILGLKELKASEKLVFARIAGFRKFFESSQATAEFIGLSKLVVERAKRNLVKLGYIVEIGDTGRGKIYRAADAYSILDAIDRQQIRPAEKVKPDMTKKSDQTLLKSQTENKYRINIEHTKRDESAAQGVENSEKQERGRKDINELIDLWEVETKITIKGDQNQRRQIYNLTRKYGVEGTQLLIKRVGKMKQACDRYAPSIMKPSDLVGKYSKLDRMLAWEERQRFAPKQPTPPRITPTKFEDEEISDEERARISAQIKAAREKLGFSHNNQS